MESSETVAAPSDTQPSSPIDDSFSMEDHQEAKKSRGGKPKLFQCTGYGDCRMVFTRSEHLARHMRKHTGEKPFKCVVPGCSRMFSRFDNMMQHTQTHNKARGAPRRPKGSGKSKDRLGSSEQSLSDADSSYDHSGLPSPPPSRREHAKQLNKTRMRRHRQLQRKNYAEDDEEDELDYADSDGDQLVHSGDSDSDTNSYHMLQNGGSSVISQQRAMFAEMRRSSRNGYALPMPQSYSSYGWPTSMPKTTLDYDSIWPPPPPPSIQAPIPLMPSTSSSSQHPIDYRQQRLSESPMSSSSSTSTTDSLPNTSRRQRTTPKVQFHPYPYNKRYRRHSTTDDHRYVLRPLYPKQVEDDNDTRMILPRLATYLVAHPDEPPENYLLHHPVVYGQESLAQKRALTWPTLPGTEKAITRRLSVQDLCNPIECLERSASTTKDVNSDDKTMGKATVRIKQEEGIDLTLDEYEAIQGFGRFQKFGALK